MRHKIYEATLQARLPLSPALRSSPLPTGIINETQSYNEMRSSAGITNDVPFYQSNPCPFPFCSGLRGREREREIYMAWRLLIRGGT